jgi:hypothetical protein
MIRLFSYVVLASPVVLAMFSLVACKGDPAADGGETGTAETGTAETGTTDTGEVDCSDRPLEVPSSRSEIEAVWDAARGRMLVFAGDQGTPVSCMSQTDFVAEVWAFHTDCNNFERLEPGEGLTPRGRYALAHDAARERVLIHGGRWRAGTSGAYTVLDDLWAYELATDTWTALPAGATPRSNHIAAVVGDRLVIHGGNESTDGLAFIPLGDTWVFDLASESWSQLMTTGDPSARLFHAAVGHGHTIYMFGGGDENAFLGPFFNDLWALDVQSGAWTMLDDGQSGPPGLTASDLVYDDQGQRLLLWGGHDDTELGSRNTVWGYELGGGGWSELEVGDVYNAPAAGFCDFPADFVVPDLDAPERRHAGAAVLSDAGELLVFGGKTDCGQINDVWSWSLGDATWTERSPATVGEICLRSFANCQSLCF